MSSPSEPEDTVSTSIAFCLPRRMIEPLPNARSIWERAASSALVLSTLVPSTRRRLGWLITVLLLSWAASDPQRGFYAPPNGALCTWFVPSCKFFFCSHRTILTRPDSDRLCFWKTLLRAREAFAATAGIAKMGSASPGARLGFLPGSSERRRASVFATGLRYPICRVHEPNARRRCCSGAGPEARERPAKQDRRKVDTDFRLKSLQNQRNPSRLALVGQRKPA